MCRCAERRGAIIRGASALARGDVTAAKAEAGYVVRTATEDAKSAAARAQAAAHARLRR